MVLFQPEKDPTYHELHIERISVDITADVWEEPLSSVVLKLIDFFEQDLGPEIVDPRVPRHLGIRQPSYRLEGIVAKQNRKKSKAASKPPLDAETAVQISSTEVVVRLGSP